VPRITIKKRSVDFSSRDERASFVQYCTDTHHLAVGLLQSDSESQEGHRRFDVVTKDDYPLPDFGPIGGAAVGHVDDAHAKARVVLLSHGPHGVINPRNITTNGV
jgi:hypothetical protein